MISVQIVDYSAIIAFWLVFSRVMAIAFQLPIFDNVSIPTLVKVLMSVLISYTFYPYVLPEVMKDINHYGADSFWYLTFFYTITGLVIGYFVKVIMTMFIAAGSIITQQIGFAAVRYFDPSSNSQVGPFEKLIQWTVLLIILSSGAILPMFKGIFNSFFSIHVYDIGKLAKSPEFFIMFFKSIFISSLMLAGPMIFTNILVYSILGIVARMVPQMNIIMVSFAVNIGVGMIVFISISDEFFRVAYQFYTLKLGEWFQYIL